MARAKSEETREIIRAAAQKLFYEKGYADTHCKDIAQAADANIALIHYYYGSKGNLALQTYSHLIIDVLNLVTISLPDEEPSIHYIVSIYLIWDLLDSNERFCVFMQDIIDERIPYNLFGSTTPVRYVGKLAEWQGVQISVNDAELISLCSTATEMELIVDFINKDRGFSARDYAERDARIVLQMISYDRSSSNEMLSRAAKLADSFSVQLTDSFEVNGRINR